jgi:transcriptional regulator with XRE-family HTH domain
MDDARVGAAFRAVRLRRRWRQQDVANAAGVSRATVSRLERGWLSLDGPRAIARVLDIRLEATVRWRGGELDRLLNARHSALHESLAMWFRARRDWVFAPEVSFSIYGERGVIDVLAWHPARRALLVIELKTDVVDVQELIGTADRKHRLATKIARGRGWASPAAVSLWVVVLATKTNRRRVALHAAVLRAAFPLDGRGMRGWLRDPTGPVAALSFWSNAHEANGKGNLPSQQRVRRVHERPG